VNITLRLAWRNLWRQPRRTWLTTGAMIFSNVLLVFMISLQVGMYQMMIENTLRADSGHLQVQAEGYRDEQKMRQTVPEVAGLAAALREELGLESVAPRAVAFALASSEDRSYGIQVRGVDPALEARVSSLPGLVREGRFLSEEGYDEIVVGSVLARNLRTVVGDELTLLGSGRDGSFAAAVAVVVGIIDAGVPDLDRSFAEVPLDFFQETFSMGETGHAVVVLAPGLLQVASLKTRMRAAVPVDAGLVVLDWMALQPGLKQAVQADFASAWLMYGVLIILVAFSVLNTQLMSVLERTREFGIVLSLGMTPGRLGRLVLLETILMGLLGMAIGIALGALVVGWLTVQGFTYPGLEEMAGKFNLPDRIYPSFSAIGLLLGPSVLLLASVAASLYPVVKLYLLEPVAAMRSA
jgi:ABC-type lipoprotein release transport system permease subunit